jgi:hypothetical protein
VLNAVERAANAGVVIVVSAGNGGDGSEAGIDPNQPDPFAASLARAGNGNVLIVGSVNDQGEISDFSNRAGDLADGYILARGERICCVYEDGELFITEENGQRFVTLFSGTSFSAPQVAGAVALLAQAFPNLSATEIVEILLDSAIDVGDTGTDNIHGRGWIWPRPSRHQEPRQLLARAMCCRWLTMHWLHPLRWATLWGRNRFRLLCRTGISAHSIIILPDNCAARTWRPNCAAQWSIAGGRWLPAIKLFLWHFVLEKGRVLPG